MNGFFKLLQFEVHRFRYILAGLMALTLLCQFGSLIWTVLTEVASRKEAMLKGDTVSNNSVLFPGDDLSFATVMFQTQFWFAVPILVSITVLVLYVLLIWYREWFGKDTFIYRLLMLPIARRQIFLAKYIAILLFVFSMLSFQVLLLVLQHVAFFLMVPPDMRISSYFTDAVAANQALTVLLPHRFDDFLLRYGAGAVGVLAVFTAVLIERSYRAIGILYAILFLAGCVIAVLFPFIGLGLNDPGSFLYPNEIFAVELIMFCLIVAASLWLGFKLLNEKISV